MYTINEEGLKKLNLYTETKIAREVGITNVTVANVKKGLKIKKLTAYALTKVLDNTKEIKDYFNER